MINLKRNSQSGSLFGHQMDHFSIDKNILAKTKEELSSALFRLCMIKGILYTSEEILEETRDVLLHRSRIRRKYSYLDSEVERFIELIRENSTLVGVLSDIRVIERDPKDDMIIACAVAAHADYIVSRDLDLLDLKEYQGIRIISPEEFIHYLRSEEL